MATTRLKDIAERAGVSVMTVSKALRDASDISAGTKTRLKLLAQQMGYVPDSMAQSLRNRKTKLLGLIIPSAANPIFARTILAIEERAHQWGYEILFAQSQNIAEREDSCILRLLSRKIDGLLISPVYRPATEVRSYLELFARGTPTVILGHTAPFCRQFVHVESDDLAGSHDVTQHLLKFGHRRIAYFAGPALAPWAQERLEGYRRALREVDLEIEDRLIFQAGNTIEDGEKAALQMLQESCDATAVQTASDLVAIGCAETFLNQGARIPGDLSIAGYGNLLTSEYYRVPLTTARQPKQRLGAVAMELLLQLIQGEKPESKRLPAPLAIRASTAPPPASRKTIEEHLTRATS
jgi:LacI family transcriptional regulator